MCEGVKPGDFIFVLCNPIVFGFASCVAKVEFEAHNLEWNYLSLGLNF